MAVSTLNGNATIHSLHSSVNLSITTYYWINWLLYSSMSVSGSTISAPHLYRDMHSDNNSRCIISAIDINAVDPGITPNLKQLPSKIGSIQQWLLITGNWSRTALPALLAFAILSSNISPEIFRTPWAILASLYSKPSRISTSRRTTTSGHRRMIAAEYEFGVVKCNW